MAPIGRIVTVAARVSVREPSREEKEGRRISAAKDPGKDMAKEAKEAKVASQRRRATAATRSPKANRGQQTAATSATHSTIPMSNARRRLAREPIAAGGARRITQATRAHQRVPSSERPPSKDKNGSFLFVLLHYRVFQSLAGLLPAHAL